MDLFGQSALALSTMSLGLGLSVFARNPKNKLNLAYFLWVITVGGWSSCIFLGKLFEPAPFNSISWIFHAWMAPACVVFLRMMLRDRSRWSGWVFEISLFSALGLTVLILFGGEAKQWIEWGIRLSPFIIFSELVSLFFQDVQRYSGSGRLRIQSAWIGLAAGRKFLSYMGGWLTFFCALAPLLPSWGPFIQTASGILLTISIFFLAQVVSKQRFLDFESVLSRFLILVGVSIGLTGIYSLLYSMVEKKPALFFLNSFFVSFLLLTLLEPLRSLVRKLTRKLLRRRYLKLEVLIQDYQGKLMSALDPKILFDQIENFIEQAISPRAMAIYFIDEGQTIYRRVRDSNKETQKRIEVDEVLTDHPILKYTLATHQRGATPILFAPILSAEANRSASKTQREFSLSLANSFQAMKANLLLPMIHENRLLGFALLWIDGAPEPWGNDLSFLQFIYPYFEQCARSYSSLEVYIRQRDKERLAELGEMAAGLAHEIRNPLGAILGATELLRESENEEMMKKSLQVIEEEGKRLDRVVREFLDYSRPSSFSQQEVDLVEITKKAIERVKTASFDETKEILFHAPSNPVMTVGSPSSLHQVVVNLIENGLKAIEKRGRGGKLEVSVSHFGKGSPRSGKIIIEDNGQGISKENLGKIFIPFFTTSPSGTGLGLSICQKIVDAHRGRIEVASEEGKYSRFSVILPGSPKDANP